ncbi:MAG: hypothetical protein ACT4P8_17575 [Betaproteobacteria bacterium]
MTSLEKRLAKLSGRMSREAWLKLRTVRQHPHLTELLSNLEKVDGTLSIDHIQRALRQFLSQRTPKK